MTYTKLETTAGKFKEPVEFEKAIEEALQADGASFIQVKVQVGHVPVPWTALDGTENKYRFIRHIEKTENLQIVKPPKKKITPEDKV